NIWSPKRKGAWALPSREASVRFITTRSTLTPWVIGFVCFSAVRYSALSTKLPPGFRPLTVKSANFARSCFLQPAELSLAERVSGLGLAPVTGVTGVAFIIALNAISNQRFSCVERLAEDSISRNKRSRNAVEICAGSIRSRAQVQRASVRVPEEKVSGLN